MKELSVRGLNLCRHLLICITLVGGFILWLKLPVKTNVHFDLFLSGDRIGHKIELLILFVLPFFAYIPLGIPEYHLESEESKEKIAKKKKMNAIIQLIMAIILSIIVWVPLITQI